MAGLLALEFILSNLQVGNAVGLSWSQDVCGTRTPACGSWGALSAQGPRRVHGNLVRARDFPAPPLLPDAEGPVLGPQCHCGLWLVWSWTESSPGERGTSVSSFLTI